ncbi:MAG: Mrp/NBP35 family ATP-binding protein [Candidatus Aceula meridiana]|nr:Mrp/NBP35 family ATP-binding protein [Candidatus Aceula meridiana]
MQKVDEKKEISKEKRLQGKMQRIKQKIIVMSGKGGVGKTTVAVNLAYELASQGNSVGILDVDIHGPNIAKMLGIEDVKISTLDEQIQPCLVLPNLKAMSISMLMEDKDQPIIWRGPLKMKMIEQFLSDVDWGDLDYLIIDSPPGTGDEPLSVCQLISQISGAIIVTTPQDVAILDSRKSVLFAKFINVPVLGIIENMSGFICPHCEKSIEIFGQGGGEKAAEDLKVPYLGRIPIDSQIVKQGDAGKPFVQFNRNDFSACRMDDIVKRVINSLENE